MRRDDSTGSAAGSNPRRPRFRLLLAAIVTVVAVVPIVREIVGPSLLLRLLFVVVFVAAVVDLYQDRRLFKLALALALPAVVVRIVAAVSVVGLWPHLFIVSHALTGLFLLFTAAVAMRGVMAPGRIDADRIVGAVSVYLLLGLVWAYSFGVIELRHPGSLELTASQQQEIAVGETETLIYYSFVTLTTLGYGDIAPLTPLTRAMSWVEATLGQLYVAVTIAWLVGLTIAGEKPPKD